MNCTDGVEFDYSLLLCLLLSVTILKLFLFCLASPDGSKYKTTLRGINARKFIQEDRDLATKKLISVQTSELSEDDQLIVVKIFLFKSFFI